MTSLPKPSTEALAHSQQLSMLIRAEIEAAGGWIDFARYMHLALYAPSLGYYSGGAKRFGHDGDFVTAPEISPLFAQTLARQAAQILQLTAGDILELGAGTGRLAAALMLDLQQLKQLPARYQILEVSAHLRQIQHETLQQTLPPELMQLVQWLDNLPDTFNGLVLGNEVLDALSVHIVKSSEDGLFERGIIWSGDTFVWSERPLTSGPLFELTSKLSIPKEYTTEICSAATGLVASLANMLQQGALLFIDYGFSRREYYHPQRSQGTLICHYRHYAHDDPFLHPGLQDITAHVDFTNIAETAVANGLQLLGYSGQAQFLINCGITDLLAQISPSDSANYLPLAAQAQKLLSPAEMGELFKVIALGKGLKQALLGFARGDRSHTL
jgi:SAM-dependent MidA family methyltransferase